MKHSFIYGLLSMENDLQFTATLNHLAANMNQVAKKRNQEETFNAIERAELNDLSNDIKNLAQQIKSYLL